MPQKVPDGHEDDDDDDEEEDDDEVLNYKGVAFAQSETVGASGAWTLSIKILNVKNFIHQNYDKKP